MTKYDLHKLGWQNFQQLCLSILRTILGQTVQAFLDSNDGGRDGAFSGVWQQNKGEDLSGQFVIQCKFTSKQDSRLTLSVLKDEFTKVTKLVLAGNCDSYILLTNMSVSANTEAKIKNRYLKLGVQHVLILSFDWICQQIDDNKALRASVPRIYGLGDLSEILDERVFSQAKTLLSSMRDDLSKVVITESYRKALVAVQEHGFVLLIGEPAAGKTTIASMLAMSALDQWKTRIYKLETAGKVIQHWNADNPEQFFWIDDAFGVTQYELGLAREWNHVLPQIKTMIGQGVKVILTSRNYIYNKARNDLKLGAFPLLQESQVVIDVHKLQLDERKQILYNHIKLGNQPKSFKSKLKPFLDDVASNDRFVPETARRLADPIFTKGLYLTSWGISDFVEKQESLLKEVISGLGTADQAALGLIYMRKGNLESPVALSPMEENAVDRLGSDLSSCITSLEALKGSLVQFVAAEDRLFWRFKHPTISDAFSKMLVEKPELLEIFIQGSNTEDLLRQVTCGDVGLQEAVIVPRQLFGEISKKLNSFTATKRYKENWSAQWGARRDLLSFLSRRCNKLFLIDFLNANPKLLQEISVPGLYLDSVPEVDLVIRLHELGILPESNRETFVEKLCDYAVKGKDLFVLHDEDIQKICLSSELEDIKTQVENKLIPRLSEVRNKFANEFTASTNSPEEHMEKYLEMLSIIKSLWEDKPGIQKLVKSEIEETKDWIAQNDDNTPVIAAREFASVDVTEQYERTRSIFDDVDE